MDRGPTRLMEAGQAAGLSLAVDLIGNELDSKPRGPVLLAEAESVGAFVRLRHALPVVARLHGHPFRGNLDRHRLVRRAVRLQIGGGFFAGNATGPRHRKTPIWA